MPFTFSIVTFVIIDINRLYSYPFIYCLYLSSAFVNPKKSPFYFKSLFPYKIDYHLPFVIGKDTPPHHKNKY